MKYFFGETKAFIFPHREYGNYGSSLSLFRKISWKQTDLLNKSLKSSFHEIFFHTANNILKHLRLAISRFFVKSIYFRLFSTFDLNHKRICRFRWFFKLSIFFWNFKIQIASVELLGFSKRKRNICKWFARIKITNWPFYLQYHIECC